MNNPQGLVKTLDFQLDIQSDNEGLLYDATLEARRVYNETIRFAKDGVDWNSISPRLEDDADLVKNTTQRIVAKALGAMENYYEYDDFGKPSHTKDGTYPLRANYEEGYNLSLTDDGDVAFRISAAPYKHVKGVLEGSDAHLDLLKTALTGDEWKVSTSETLWRDGEPELHVNIRNTKQTVRDKQDSRTVVGVDVNEDNVALTALSTDGVEDTLVIDFPEIKFERHRYFTMRKRVQNAGKDSMHDTLEGREERFVRDRLHKVSRHIVEWSQQFERSCIVFEDLKEMRDSIDYGTRMNRRLHHLPFRALQFYTSYKASFEGIPTGWINPEYTSQRCPMCGHTERANRNKKRFKCKDCEHQDHSDRGASVNIAVKGIEKHQDWNVPALNSLPQVRKVRRQASGAVDAPTATHSSVRDDRDPSRGMASRTVGVSD
ncbi:IS200/IS605 family element transposase accessory protein TnpB (plasmid) [Halorubrum salinarum]|uniref:IS200/IS605 family element transposase accessory protein TnpB n=1 Tax=Halorubrum salinarum TaxID=2739057 RepID=A0A7D4D4F8_9EURY|nr:RNA-guided endonuclease TnpB family protein [Halorubrum salinarum]QKG94282.1 IS200/IS605 family element transposase accessory protein TnpB [Halorubrum salinarum]